MPLVAWWFPEDPHLMDLELLDELGCYTTHLRNHSSGIDVEKGLSSSWSRVWIYMGPRDLVYACYEKGRLLLRSASPTHAPFVPFVALVFSLSYGHEDMVISGAESLWDSSSRQGILYLYNLQELFSTLYIHTALNGHLHIKEERVAPGSMVSPMLLPQLLL